MLNHDHHTSNTSAMTLHSIAITTEYLNAHFFTIFIFVYVLQDCVKALFYANFCKRLNSSVYSAPPCILECWNGHHASCG